MKKGIHPNWHPNAPVTCSCGNAFTVGSIQEGIDVDICSKCHPFFTGEVRFVDRQGRVERFIKKMQIAEEKKAAESGKSASKKTEKVVEDSQSYKDILRQQQVALKKAEKTKKEVPAA